MSCNDGVQVQPLRSDCSALHCQSSSRLAGEDKRPPASRTQTQLTPLDMCRTCQQQLQGPAGARQRTRHTTALQRTAVSAGTGTIGSTASSCMQTAVVRHSQPKPTDLVALCLPILFFPKRRLRTFAMLGSYKLLRIWRGYRESFEATRSKR